MAKKSIFGILLFLICISDSSLPVLAHHFFLLIRQRKLKNKTELTISDCHVKSKGSQELKEKKTQKLYKLSCKKHHYNRWLTKIKFRKYDKR